MRTLLAYLARVPGSLYMLRRESLHFDVIYPMRPQAVFHGKTAPPNLY